MSKPLIQIDDEIREMNNEEYAAHLERIAKFEAKEQAKLDAELKKTAALSKLEALGLDLDDLKAIGLG